MWSCCGDVPTNSAAKINHFVPLIDILPTVADDDVCVVHDSDEANNGVDDKAECKRQ